MSEELRECPFCGGELMFCPSHVEGDFFVNKPGGVCEKCGMKFTGRGYRVYGEVKSEDFSNNKFFELWNTRPTEQYLKKRSDIYKATVFNLKREIKEYKSKILINGCHTLDELGLYKILEKLLSTISFTCDEKGEMGTNDDTDR